MEMEVATIVPMYMSVTVGVVIFLVGLVFVFGFKSSAQPPSFDFDDDTEKKHRRSRKKVTWHTQ